MKRTIITAICMAFLLCGCSSKSDSGSSSKESTPQSQSQSSEEANSNVDINALGEIAISSGEWPSMYVPTGDEFSDYFGVAEDDEMFSQIYASFCPMSAILTEVILIVPANGNEENVQKFLDERKTLLIEKYAYYPTDKELAENAIIGNENGVYYLLCAENAESAEQAIKSELS